MTKAGKASARAVQHANILLLADANADNRMDKEIAAVLHVALRTVERIRMWCVTEGIERALHRKPSLYEAFDAKTANRLAKRIDLHFTPKHGSWLNITEIELRALTGQCLDRRIATLKELRKQVTVRQHQRNKEVRAVDWRFTTEDARIKLKHLYPILQT
ncbi:MAG: transposase [Planctomycetes bacterium]|nr:transposase [Planctomycetota bacterium]